MRRRALRLGLGGLAGIVGLVALGLAAPGREPPGFLLPIPVELAIGWSFVGAGLIGWARRPNNRIGRLMTLTGLVWFGRQLEWLDTPLASHLSHVSVNLFLALIAHQLVVIPSGAARTRLERTLVASAYAVALGGYIVSKLFYDPRLEGCPGCPQNLLLVSANSQLNAASTVVPSALAILLVLVILARLAWRWRVASPPARRVLGPVVWTGWAALLVVLVTIGLYAGEVSPTLDRALQWSTLAYTAIPLAFLAGLLRTRLHRGALSGLLVDLGDAASPAAVRGALAQTLGDPSLEVAFWLPDQKRYVDLDGRPFEMPMSSERATSVLEHEGRRVAALVYDPPLLEDPELVRAAGAAARMALENARLQAELRAQLEEVRASRARIVEAEDEIAQTLDELRSLARGIHPAVLTEEGLGPAVEALARRASLPVQVEALPTSRLPSAVEAAAYFVASEALANVAKHASASGVTIAMRRMNDALVIDISDDGVGGADPASGTGLVGLRDRVEALNGSLRVESPPGQGTRLHAEIPFSSEPNVQTARG